jgi:hypothetical protein
VKFRDIKSRCAHTLPRVVARRLRHQFGISFTHERKNPYLVSPPDLELFIAFACPQALLAGSSGSTTTEIEPGTTINQQNWRRYRNFMSEGLAALFQGDHFWHLPADLSIQVGPTISIPLPKKYLEDTSRYSSQVRASEDRLRRLCPDGVRCRATFPASAGGESFSSRPADLLELVLPISAARPRCTHFHLRSTWSWHWLWLLSGR